MVNDSLLEDVTNGSQTLCLDPCDDGCFGFLLSPCLVEQVNLLQHNPQQSDSQTVAVQEKEHEMFTFKTGEP